MRPQRLDDLLTNKAVIIGQSQKLYQFRRPPTRPCAARHLPPPDADPEGSEQLYTDMVALQVIRQQHHHHQDSHAGT